MVSGWLIFWTDDSGTPRASERGQAARRVSRCAAAPEVLWAQHHNGVFRTVDGGRTFEVLREGLPQVHAYDLVYRHALDVDGEGTGLAMGSTTGNLWASDDGGARWSLRSAHLPPIYQVAFGR